ncbi:MAG: hypothetical protein V7635_1479 [Arthrobacter sp.]
MAASSNEASDESDNASCPMKITVERSGGFAGMRRSWTVRPAPDEKDRWRPLVEACPWDAVPEAGRDSPDGPPDRYTYSIRAGKHRATLPERELTGPWRDLVDSAKAAAESAPPPESPGGPGPGTPRK